MAYYGGKGRGRGGGGGGGGGVAGACVYVGNLSWETTWQDLKDHFRAAGEVSHADVMQEHDGRSKGCGIVSFASARDAANAIRQLHDTELQGRKIFVREDREAETGGLPAPGSRGGRGGGAPAGLPPARSQAGRIGSTGASVYVGNLSWETTWQDLKDHFRAAGEVSHADVMQEHDGRSKGCGIVSFARAGDAANAIATLNQTELGGRVIFVREDREAETGHIGGLPAPGTRSPGLAASQPSSTPIIGGGLPPARGRGGGAGGRGGGAVATGGMGGLPAGGGTRVYVGNLSWETSWQDLKDHFRAAGEVSHADVMQEHDGRSKGCGIVSFASARDAANAIRQLHDTELQGRKIFVREDREAAAPAGKGKGQGTAGCQVYVGNLSWETSWMNLKV